MIVAHKKHSTHEDWLAIPPLPLAEAEALVDRIAERIEPWTFGRRIACAWSGGKDSVLLAEAARRAGVRAGVCVLTKELEFPAMDRWCVKTLNETFDRPAIIRRPLTLDWLADHPKYLFPATQRDSAAFMSVNQWTGQRQYSQINNLDVMLFGRRLAEANQCGVDGVATHRDGVLRVSPMYDVTNDETLGAVLALQLPLAPCYSWPRGYRVGSGPWPKRRHDDGPGACWREVALIDASVIDFAVRRFPEAGQYKRFAC